MLIFLDLDGVLRRTDSTPYRFDSDCRTAFEGALRSIPGAKVVITSSWREVMNLDELRAHFSPDVADRVVGVTPMTQSIDGHRPPTAHVRSGGSRWRRHVRTAAASGPPPMTRNRIAPGTKWSAKGEPASADNGSGMIWPRGPSMSAAPPPSDLESSRFWPAA
jgi:hypothetical protein